MKEIKYSIKYKIEDSEKEKIIEFFNSFDTAAIEQFPGWPGISGHHGPIAYFTAISSDTIVAYVQVLERFGKEARIHFGPLSPDKDILVDSLEYLVNYYKSRGFFYLSVQLANYVSQDSMYVQYKLYKRKPFITKIDKYNKSTVVTRLDKDIEVILKNFAPNHKGSIKKAIKEGLTAKILHSPDEIREFAKKYSAMYKARNLPIDEEECTRSFLETLTFFEKYGKGYFLGVINANNELIGGVMIINQGNTALYIRGYSDMIHRQLPITHIGLYEAIKIAQKEHRAIFDFCGYNFFVDEKDQLSKVNFFKSGFSKEFFFYPPLMHFRLNPIGYYLYNFLRGVKRRINHFKEKQYN